MGEVKLKACPFCGGDAEFVRLGTRRQPCQVACTMCGTHHESPDEDEMSGTSWNRREGGPAAKDPFASDLHMHPSDWERVAEGRDKLRERREEIVRAFDSAMAYFGRDREHVA